MPGNEFLLLSRFRDPESEKIMRSVALPALCDRGVVRIVDRASNDPKESNFWVSVVHRLVQASDVVVLSTRRTSGNVKWGEAHYLQSQLFKKNWFDSLALACGADFGTLSTLCRPELVYFAVKRKRWGSRIEEQSVGLVTTLEVNSELSPEEQRTALNAAISRALERRAERLRKLRDGYPNLFAMYRGIAQAVTSDQEVRESCSLHGEWSPPDPPALFRRMYATMTKTLRDGGVYIVFDLMIRLLSAASAQEKLTIAYFREMSRDLDRALTVVAQPLGKNAEWMPKLAMPVTALVATLHALMRIPGMPMTLGTLSRAQIVVMRTTLSLLGKVAAGAEKKGEQRRGEDVVQLKAALLAPTDEGERRGILYMEREAEEAFQSILNPVDGAAKEQVQWTWGGRGRRAPWRA